MNPLGTAMRHFCGMPRAMCGATPLESARRWLSREHKHLLLVVLCPCWRCWCSTAWRAQFKRSCCLPCTSPTGRCCTLRPPRWPPSPKPQAAPLSTQPSSPGASSCTWKLSKERWRNVAEGARGSSRSGGWWLKNDHDVGWFYSIRAQNWIIKTEGFACLWSTPNCIQYYRPV